MNDNEISNYLDYWMAQDRGFSDMLDDEEYAVTDVEHYSDRGIPRTAVSLNQDLVLLFPPFEKGFDYTKIDYNRNK